MTAYLRPGDSIHLAMPIDPTLEGDALTQEVQRHRGQLAEVYARFGVNITWNTAMVGSGLAAPTVVAVFRAGPARLWRRLRVSSPREDIDRGTPSA